MKLYTSIVCALVLVTVSIASIMDSDLENLGSGGGTKFDIVAAMTQKSVNAVVNNFLAKLPNQDVVTVVYQGTDEATGPKYNLLTLEEAIEILGFNPFDIPDRTALTDQDVQKLMSEKMTMGITAKYGLPNVPPENMMSAIRFDNSGLRVTYSLVMAEFQTFSIEFDQNSFTPYFSALSQSDYLNENPGSAPFTWPYFLDVGMKTIRAAGNSSDLPPATVEIMNETGMHFYANNRANLDLNSGVSQSIPTIPGLPPSSSLYGIFPAFANSFITEVDPSSDGVDLGLVITADRYPPLRSEEIPVDLEMVISRTKVDGNPTSDYDSYTLNYLMTTEDGLIARPMEMRWNWIEPSEVSRYQGSIAVRRGVLTNFLNKLISPELERMCFGLSATATCGELPEFGWVVGACKEPPSYEVYDTPDGSVIMKFEHTDSATAPQDQTANCSTSLTTRASSKVMFMDSKILIHNDLIISGGARGGGHDSGQVDIVKKFMETEYTLGVDETGRLHVTLEPKIDLSSVAMYRNAPNIGSFTSVPSSTSYEDLVAYVLAAVGSLEDFMRGYAGDIETRVGSVSDFVMPNEMVMRDVMFSKALDLVSHIRHLDSGGTEAWKAEKVRDTLSGMKGRVNKKVLRMRDLQRGKMGVVTKDGVKIVPFEKSKYGTMASGKRGEGAPRGCSEGNGQRHGKCGCSAQCSE